MISSLLGGQPKNFTAATGVVSEIQMGIDDEIGVFRSILLLRSHFR